MASTAMLWSPPDGMSAMHVRAWRQFYSRCLDTYGLTPEDYRLMYVAQRGRCWICRQAKGVHPDDPKARGNRRLGVDHDHITGAVRGLLCTGGDKTCNRIIGWLSAPQLERAAKYLSSRRKQPGRLLEAMNAEITSARGDGAVLSQVEIDALADRYLWRDEE